jgi:hypothetical protein
MFLMMTAVVGLVRGMSGLFITEEDKPLVALCAAARACGLASLMASTIAGGSADPGVLFFVCLAIVLSCRAVVYERRVQEKLYLPFAGSPRMSFG